MCGAKEFHNDFVVESRNLRRRVNPCAEKNFIGVNVSNARDQLLVEQNGFHRAAMFSENISELRETDVERVWAESAFVEKFVHILDQPDFPELALIIESQAPIIGKSKKHSRLHRRRSIPLQILQRAGHAEMQSQPKIAVGADKEMFAVAAT